MTTKLFGTLYVVFDVQITTITVDFRILTSIDFSGHELCVVSYF